MRVTVIENGTPHPGARLGAAPVAEPATTGGWRPRAVLGADSAGGLLLPQATPTAAHVYAPRGVWVDGERVIVCDTGNHRVLIYHGHPDTDAPDCDVVLGQPDSTSEGPQAGGRDAANGMNLPTGVLVTPDGRLVVADAWNHRLLVWDEVPATPLAPDLVLGQPDASSTEPNAGGEPGAGTFYWPFGIGLVDGRFYVADTGNRRVLCWPDGLPTSPSEAAVVLGQSDFGARDENAGHEAGAHSFRWPHAVSSDSRGGVLVADAGNHRVLGWTSHPTADVPADVVLGQPDFTTATEFPYAPQRGTRFRFPYCLALDGRGNLAVADTANNRVLLWDGVPSGPETDPAAVLGQPDFTKNGENRWLGVDRDSLCWPYGIGAHTGPAGDLIAVADSGNNRVVLWERSP